MNKIHKLKFFLLKTKYKLYLSNFRFMLYFLPDTSHKRFTYLFGAIGFIVAYNFPERNLIFAIATSCIAASIFDFFIYILNDIEKKRKLSIVIFEKIMPIIWRKNYLISHIKNDNKCQNNYYKTIYVADDIYNSIKEFVKSNRYEQEIYPENSKFENSLKRPISFHGYIEQSIKLFDFTLHDLWNSETLNFIMFYDRVISCIFYYNSRHTDAYLHNINTRKHSHFSNHIPDQISKYIKNVESLEYFLYAEVFFYYDSSKRNISPSIFMDEKYFKKYVCGD